MRINRFIGAFCALFAACSAHAFDVERTGLSGGGNLLVLEDDSVPVVNIRITFEGAGSSSDTFGARGLAYLTSQMLLEGAGTRDSDAFQDALAENAIHMSASVDKDNLTLRITSLREQVPTALELLRDALTNPQLNPADLTRVKARTTARIARLSEQPEHRAAQLLDNHIFARHPYSNPLMGTTEELNKLEAADVRAFMQTYLTSGNILVSAAGDADIDEIENLLDPMLEQLTENEIGAVPVARATLEGIGSIVREQANTPQTIILFALPWVNRADDNFYASYVLNSVLGGQGLSSLLMQDLRETDGLVYSVSSGLDLSRGSNLLVGYAATRNEKADEVIERITQRLAAIQKSGLTTQQCEAGKTYLLGRMKLELDNTASQADMLRAMQLFDLPENYLDKRTGIFEALSCSDINRMATSLLNPANITFAVIGGADAKPQ